MSEEIHHECGIAFIRLKKDATFYIEKYGDAFYGLHHLHLMLLKQRHRGQDGAGVANIKLDPIPGSRYISRVRSNESEPIKDVFHKIFSRFSAADLNGRTPKEMATHLKNNFAFTGEVFLGHLRYGTHGGNSIENCHPFLRGNNWMTRNLVVAGNFNLTNVEELFSLLIELGQHPKEKADTVTVMEKIGHFLDEENQRLFNQFKQMGYSNIQITQKISDSLDLVRVLSRATRDFDGGYVMAGMIGNGDAFVVRDPNGIRPAYYIDNDELCAIASERPALQTAFGASVEDVKEIPAGAGLIIRKSGSVQLEQIREAGVNRACSFERIYFSRGNDRDVYKERKELGRKLVPEVLRAVNYDYDNTVFSFIPNTAETAFYGVMKALEEDLNARKHEEISKRPNLSSDELKLILSRRARLEKIALKDVKMRTFITSDSERSGLVGNVYDVTYGSVRPKKDTLVVVDDSIVRGTTLKESVLRMLSKLQPAKIVIASSAPQIRYPDCYGIDMSKMGDFVAFQAAIALHHEHDTYRTVVKEVLLKCIAQQNVRRNHITNYVREIYDPFTTEQISKKIAEILRPAYLECPLEIVYQTIDGLHQSCPNHSGDWYFSGDYPTPGGNKVANTAFINFMQGVNERSY
ncbi:MAG: amidophosphoribosyltransferase [Flavobacteriales bacterium]